MQINYVLEEIESLGRDLDASDTASSVQTLPYIGILTLSLFSLGTFHSPSISPRTPFYMVITARNRTFPSIIASVERRKPGQRKPTK